MSASTGSCAENVGVAGGTVTVLVLDRTPVGCDSRGPFLAEIDLGYGDYTRGPVAIMLESNDPRAF